MRTALVAFLLFVVSPAWAAPSPQELLAAWRLANTNCRGGNPDDMKTQGECDRRERLSGRLDQLDWCYGQRGESGAEHKWHRCNTRSIRLQDLKETSF